MRAEPLRLSVNIDHAATLRNVRGAWYPEITRVAHTVEKAHADGITIHLREDRRHITEKDLVKLSHGLRLPLTVEVAPVHEMIDIMLATKPDRVCFVPERREELTTEHGLDAVGQEKELVDVTTRLKQSGIKVFLFLDPEPRAIEAARRIGADGVELHTGAYANHRLSGNEEALAALKTAAAQVISLGMACHAGHGLNYDNIGNIAMIQEVAEVSVGHFLIAEALFIGLEEAIQVFRKLASASRDTSFIDTGAFKNMNESG